MKRALPFLFLSIWIFGVSGCLVTQETPVSSSVIPARGRILKHFDRNKNGIIDPYEYGLVQTYRTRGWPLADDKRKIAFDFNQDGMLASYEYAKYQEDRQRHPNSFIPGTIRQMPTGNKVRKPIQ